MEWGEQMDWASVILLAAIAAVVLGLFILAMAVGVIFSNRQIKGSCGGLANMRDRDGSSPCMACGGSPEHCEQSNEHAEAGEEASAR
jgi:hypothetical protein